MRCPKCGAENTDGVQICQSCSGVKGFAVAAIAITVVIIIAGLVFLIFFSDKVYPYAKMKACQSNMEALGNAIKLYASDYSGNYPTGSQWCELLIKHTDVDQNDFDCLDVEGKSAYAINVNALRLGKDAPADMILMFEASNGWNRAGGPELLERKAHQDKGCNILFVDGRVELVRSEELDNLRWTVEQGD